MPSQAKIKNEKSDEDEDEDDDDDDDDDEDFNNLLAELPPLPLFNDTMHRLMSGFAVTACSSGLTFGLFL